MTMERFIIALGFAVMLGLLALGAFGPHAQFLGESVPWR